MSGNTTRLRMRMAKLGNRQRNAVRLDVGELDRMWGEGMTDGEIAKVVGCGRTIVGDVRRGVHWTVRVDRPVPVRKRKVADER